MSTGSELTKDHVRVDESADLHILRRVFQRLMECGTVGFIEPVSRIERQQLDFSAFGQFSGLIDDKTTRFDSSLQCHVTTVASPETEDKRARTEAGCVWRRQEIDRTRIATLALPE